MSLRSMWVSGEELARLRVVRATRWDELALPLFTRQERRRLRWLRWLVRSGRMLAG